MQKVTRFVRGQQVPTKLKRLKTKTKGEKNNKNEKNKTKRKIHVSLEKPKAMEYSQESITVNIN